MVTLQITFAVAAIALLAGLAIGVAIRAHQINALSFSEAAVAETLERSVPGTHVLLNDVTIETERGTTQIDHILVSEFGILVVETKHYSGWIFGDPDSFTWTQVIYKKKTKFQNPLVQNAGHIKALQALFTLPSEVFQSVVAFTGEAEFKTDLGGSVVRLHQLPSFLESAAGSKILDERKIAYIVGRIEMKRMRRSIETKEYHINSVRERLGDRRSTFN